MHALSRRRFLATAAAAIGSTSLGACGAATEPASRDDPSGVTVDTDRVTVEIDRIPAFATTPSLLVVPSARMIVVRAATTDFRAFDERCTHAGCPVGRLADQRLHCPCHGSEYDLDGRPVAGPAPLPLTRHIATLDDATRRLIVRR